MYQWTDPDSGTTQLSGTPPSWYRGEEQGPRIYVFDRGQLLDDTARSVNETQRLELRRQAFVEADSDKRAHAQAVSKARLRAAVEQLLGKKPTPEELEDILQSTSANGQLPAASEQQDQPTETASTQGKTPDTKELTAAQLKALVQNWDRAQTEQARKLLQKTDPVSAFPATGSSAATDQAASPPPTP